MEIFSFIMLFHYMVLRNKFICSKNWEDFNLKPVLATLRVCKKILKFYLLVIQRNMIINFCKKKCTKNGKVCLTLFEKPDFYTKIHVFITKKNFFEGIKGNQSF